MKRNRFTRALLVAAGSVSLALGIIGIVLPLVPTTPFVLLAAACYMRSSERLSRWLLDHPRFGPPIRAYRAGRGISRRTKVIALTTLWASISTTALLALPAWWHRLVLFAVGAGVSAYLLAQKTLPAAASAGDDHAPAQETGDEPRGTDDDEPPEPSRDPHPR